jgi:hypothetical protein
MKFAQGGEDEVHAMGEGKSIFQQYARFDRVFLHG